MDPISLKLHGDTCIVKRGQRAKRDAGEGGESERAYEGGPQTDLG